jgi:hypothetical protein
MIFKQHNDGSCDIEFSWKERITLFRKGKIHLSDESFKHFSNHLIKMIMDWNYKFKKGVDQKQTFSDTEVKIK